MFLQCWCYLPLASTFQTLKVCPDSQVQNESKWTRTIRDDESGNDTYWFPRYIALDRLQTVLIAAHRLHSSMMFRKWKTIEATTIVETICIDRHTTELLIGCHHLSCMEPLYSPYPLLSLSRFAICYPIHPLCTEARFFDGYGRCTVKSDPFRNDIIY